MTSSELMASRIKQKRTEYNMTQEDLANRLGVKRQAVCKWEKSEVADIRRSLIAKMAEIFFCDPVWLMGLDQSSEVRLTYEAQGKEPINVIVDRPSSPVIGESSKRAMLYQAALNVTPENLDVAIKLLKSLSKEV